MSTVELLDTVRARAMIKTLTVSISTLILTLPVAAQTDTAARLHHLVAQPGVSGYETAVREAIEMMLPAGARVRADNMGNIVLRTGNGSPHTMIVAPLDESGFVISAITDDGYLRVHRHTSPPAMPLGTQFFVGQPVFVLTASAGAVPGVIATPSTHLRALRDTQGEARIKTIDDLWVDLGVESRDEVEKLGVRLLDSITLRERSTALAEGRVSGVAASSRGVAVAMVEIIRRSAGRGALGTITFVWAGQAEYGHRGLLRALETYKPDRVVLLRGASNPGDDSTGAVGRLSEGPLVANGSAFLRAAAASAGVATQPLPDTWQRVSLPDRWKALDLHVASLPVRYAQTPVETVDAADVDRLAAMLTASVGLPPLGPSPPFETPPAPQISPGDEPLRTLQPLIAAYGVSGHESPVRDYVVKHVPQWAKPEVDERGNITVSFGEGGKSLVFVAHMDEVGFEIASIAEDGSAALRPRGGMYLSVYEAHPVNVVTPTGLVPAVLAPRANYTTATESQPNVEQLTLDFGTESAAATSALGVAVGQSATVRKQLMPLGSQRATGRSMDDRNGSAALLLALRRIDPASVKNQVTFAWSVEEETGLTGAQHLATRFQPDTAFAVDTFVSSDTPVDLQRLAGAKLGRGAVLRVLDSRTIVPPQIVDRVVGIARSAKIPLQLGTTSGGTDSSVFSAGGAIDVGLSWPGRYSHSPVEIMDKRDLDALVRLIVALAREY
jgi:putative aminopeptidase FrvX